MKNVVEYYDTYLLAANNQYLKLFRYSDGDLNLIKKCIPSTTECYPSTSTNYVSALTTSGYSLLVWVDANSNGGWIYVDIDGPKRGKNASGKDIFPLKFVFRDNGVNNVNDKQKSGIWFSGLQYMQQRSREQLVSGRYCGALIQYDGWQFKPDNPCY